MKKLPKKLHLLRETLHTLQPNELTDAVAAGYNNPGKNLSPLCVNPFG
jgi:hypothetical protein